MIANYANKIMDNEYNMFMSMMHVCVSKHLYDEHFTVLWANDFFYELIGYDKDEYTRLFHNHVDEYYKDSPGAVEAMGAVMMKAYKNHEPGYEFECEMPTKGGKRAWIRVRGRFSDEVYEGLPVIYATYLDITNLKEMQLQLEEALHMAEEANQAKSDFLSRMSHDIRTPMNAIVGMTEIASSNIHNTDKVQDCLKKISLSSQHLLGLINDVLDMSKIESGKMTANIGPILLPELMDNVVAIIQPAIKDKDLQFSVRLHHMTHEHFFSDMLRLRQVFINILSNACKFTPEGGSITLDAKEDAGMEPDTAILTFTFTDTGIGMKPDFVNKIFDVFTREQDSRVDKTEGSGLGMAITKKIVDMLGGTITVHSTPGKGSSFVVQLPMKLDLTEADDLKLPPLKLLIADDDEAVCEYAAQVLTESGASVDWTTEGERAVSMIEEAHRQDADYDAVILDWKMPGQDGLHTARQVHQMIGGKSPILMISAYDWSDIEERAKSAGVSGFLQKPLFRSTLIHGLKAFLLGQNPAKNTGVKTKHYDFKGARFLLVEDNELNIEVARELFAPTGAMVESARDGAQGVKKFSDAPKGYYDLILMDIQMPVMNGYTATRKIRELPREDAATIPIVAMTADAFTEDIEAAKEAGMDGHLAKPLDMTEVNRTIANFLNREKQDH